ncbi:MAG: sulfatase [Chloroflexi bacterium]|nr:sulfatase [Chloroflexota bacterium]
MTDLPDILFIVLDTQRADRLGCYGHKKAITPNLDKFAEQGTLFEQAISPAQWTIPTHASLFTGLYPTTHQVTQSSQSLPETTPHLAEVLQAANYQTVGFCNNPLVGILNNGFRRGFDTFYNYGGAIPSLPQNSSRLPWPLNKLAESYTQFLRRISYPIQNFFGQSDLAFRLSLNAFLTPIWSRLANFKGQNARSVKDVVYFLQQHEKKEDERPLFLFLNLMETHLPFWPPGEYIDKTAPYFKSNKEARDLMRKWNHEAYRWAAPLSEPMGELEERVLSDMYDAEVAYQDDYLGQLFEVLDGRSNKKNTLTIIVADHGDGLGDHGYMGHAFVAYQELVHVPMMMQWPTQMATPRRINTPVSTRRIYHTILDAIGRLPAEPQVDPVQVHKLTLLNTINGRDPENGTAYSEIYPPMTFVRAIEKRQPELLEQHRCLSTRRAVVQISEDQPYKLIEIEDESNELFNLATDPLELEDVKLVQSAISEELRQELKRIAAQVEAQRSGLTAGEAVDIDEHLLQRLRGLGYID